MNRIVSAVAGRLSLRPPQRRSLEILDRLCELAPPRKNADRSAALAAIREEFPTVTDFEREFASLCFALATGVGKTRLMGAFVSYLHLAHGINNFFVLAPNLTIYNKLIADFTPNTPKYVLQGISDFAVRPPAVVTGDTYESEGTTLLDRLDSCRINIFNISKINSEVRGGKSPRIKKLAEYIGTSYFEYLATLPDLVLLMDESHRYRASAGVRAINELRPILGLELTATPFVESPKGPVDFRNVVYRYQLAQAMEDGFVKEPTVVTRKDFLPAEHSPETLETIKLEDGVRLHESVKVELATYALQTGLPAVKPFVLVIARDTVHAAALLAKIESEPFFDGRYRGRAIQVDSSKTGKDEDEMIGRLLQVEHSDEPTEIVIHVNMLKEGWDVTNLYTIVPLRAANARTLVEQSIGRGLRLPYGKRTGVAAVDRLNIVAHDKFQEIVEMSRGGDSPLRIRTYELDPRDTERPVSMEARPGLFDRLGLEPEPAAEGGKSLPAVVRQAPTVEPIFRTEQERQTARLTLEVIKTFQSRPNEVPTVAGLKSPEIQAELAAEVRRRLRRQQGELFETSAALEEVVSKTTDQVVLGTIDIPRIALVPIGEVRSGYRPFKLSLQSLRYNVPSDDLWLETLRTGEREILSLGRGGVEERRLEDYVVGGLVDFDDVSYDDHADLLYDLAEQVVQHFRTALGYDEEPTRRVLRVHQKAIANLVHVQMADHFWEEAAGWETIVRRGFTELKKSVFTTSGASPVRDYRDPPQDKGTIGRFVYGGFARCLYDLQKFQSDTERKMAVILESDSLRWFRPARGQFQIFWTLGREQQEYQPDFVAEAETAIYMIETKAASELTAPEVQAKCDAGTLWCKQATDFAATHGGKPWSYLLIPHDVVAGNRTLADLAHRCVRAP